MSDDVISRQAAIDEIRKCRFVVDAIEKIRGLPSADRPKGHWVLINRGLGIYMCDLCGEILQIDRVPIWDYCPVCGADMRGE